MEIIIVKVLLWRYTLSLIKRGNIRNKDHICSGTVREYASKANVLHSLRGLDEPFKFTSKTDPVTEEDIAQRCGPITPQMAAEMGKRASNSHPLSKDSLIGDIKTIRRQIWPRASKIV